MFSGSKEKERKSNQRNQERILEGNSIWVELWVMSRISKGRYKGRAFESKEQEQRPAGDTDQISECSDNRVHFAWVWNMDRRQNWKGRLRLHWRGEKSFILIVNEKHSFLKNLFYWSIVDLQYCVNFYCTAKWFSCTYIYTYSFLYYFPLWFITGYWI